MRRSLVIVVSLLFLLSLTTMVVAAEGDAVKNVTKGTSYATLSEAVSDAAENDTLELVDDLILSDSIRISKPLTLDLKGHSITSTMSRSGDQAGSLITVSSDLTLKGSGGSITNEGSGVRALDVSGTLNMSDTTIEGFALTKEQINEHGAAIRTNDGKLQIDNCTFKGNKVLGKLENWMYRLSYKTGGGAIAAQNVSHVIIRNSVFDGNEASEVGGAILQPHDTGSLEVYDSTFTNNISKTGGAIAMFSTVKGILDGNTFENNSAVDEENRTYVVERKKPDWAIDPDDENDDGYYFAYYSFASGRGGALYILPTSDSDIVLRNNKMIGNKANRGGAISAGSDTSKGTPAPRIESGLFEGNFASAGGAIDYTAHNMKPLYLEDALITGNSAVRGGGIWLCPQGSIELSSALGGTVIGNTTSGSTSAYNLPGTISANGDDICHEGSDSKDVKQTLESPGGVSVSTRGPGGVKVDWYTDEADARYSSGPGTKAITAIEKDSYPDIYNGTDKSFGIHGVIPGVNKDDQKRLIKEAEKGAQIILRNNHATRGGAIAANSPVVFGEKNDEEQEISITGDLYVNKKWNGRETSSMIFIDLIRYDVDKDGNAIEGGDRVVLDRDIVISAAGGWNTFFTDLPKEYTDSSGNRRYCKYTIEEQPSPVYEGRITDVKEDGNDTIIELTNTPKSKRKGAEDAPDDDSSSEPGAKDKDAKAKDQAHAGSSATSDQVDLILPVAALCASLLLIGALLIARRRRLF